MKGDPVIKDKTVLLWQEGLTASQIAKRLGITYYRARKIVVRHAKAPLNGPSGSKPVVKLGFRGEVIKTYESITKAYIDTGIQPSNICDALKGRAKQAGGYKWRYACQPK